MNNHKKSNAITLIITFLVILIGVFALIMFTDILLKPNESIKSKTRENTVENHNAVPVSEIKLYPWSALNTETQTEMTSEDIDFFHSAGLEKQISEMIQMFYNSTLNRSDFMIDFKVLRLKDEPKKNKYYVLKDFYLDDSHLLNCIISSDGQFNSFYISSKDNTDLQNCYQIIQKQLNTQLSDENIKRLSSLKRVSENLNQFGLSSIVSKFPAYIKDSTYSIYNVDNMITIKFQITDSTLFFLFVDGATSEICGFHVQTY